MSFGVMAEAATEQLRRSAAWGGGACWVSSVVVAGDGLGRMATGGRRRGSVMSGVVGVGDVEYDGGEMGRSWIGEGIVGGGGERQAVEAAEDMEAVRLRRLEPCESWW
jgi:hypothetical protein